ncbi:MAG: hypothetical protein LUD77_02665, partial [Clostridiales bacterium]|nr:hypothetical protein [Clostridiales bacterium]
KIMENVTAISAGGMHSMALTADGNLYTWGGNYAGQLGTGNHTDLSIPKKVKSLVIAISAGDHHSMAVTENGNLYVWGANEAGQIGNGTQGSDESYDVCTPPQKK